METRKYLVYLLTILLGTCQIVKCFIVQPVQINDSKEIFTKTKNYKYYCNEYMIRPAVSKCCDITLSYSNETKSCIESFQEFLPDFEDCHDYSEKVKEIPVKKRYEYYIGPCQEGSYLLDPNTFPEEKYVIYSNGTLLVSNISYNVEEYCLETIDGSMKAFVCFESKINKYSAAFPFTYYATGLLISVLFLIITAVLYVGTDQLRDVKGKSLACHCFCLAFAYLFLSAVQLWSEYLNDETCEAFGFLIQYFFVAAFAWLNVLCYDMWSSIKKDINSKAEELDLKSQKLTFIVYCMYGFFVSAALIVVSLIMNYSYEIPENYIKPKFGSHSCWFYSSIAAVSYFYAPVGVMLLANLLFFLMSVFELCKGQRKALKETTKKYSETRNEVNNFHLCCKLLKESLSLFLLMGLNFIADLFSWAFGSFDHFWLIMDFLNIMQGIIIFFLFVLRPKVVRNILKKKLNILYFRLIKCNWSHKENQGYQEPLFWNVYYTSEKKNHLQN